MRCFGVAVHYYRWISTNWRLPNCLSSIKNQVLVVLVVLIGMQLGSEFEYFLKYFPASCSRHVFIIAVTIILVVIAATPIVS